MQAATSLAYARSGVAARVARAERAMHLTRLVECVCAVSELLYLR
jgi:hypothetical protein